MKCHEARRLFGSYWDDETTQAEREWLESHFAACGSCRLEYEQLARMLETVSGLPRQEASPDLLEHVLALTRRVSPALDVLPERRVPWVPATAAAAVLLIAVAAVSQWAGLLPGAHPLDRGLALVRPAGSGEQGRQPAVSPPHASETTVASVPDSIFDHSDDVEFVLDPVTLRRGRATVARPHLLGPQTEQAVVSF